MILLAEGKYIEGPVAFDLSKALWFQVTKKAIRIIFPDSEIAHVVELGTELSDEEKEQLAYYISILKNRDEVTELKKLLKAVKKEEGQK